jgi:hypothetical protein
MNRPSRPFVQLTIAHDYRGDALAPEHVAHFQLSRDAEALCIEVDAPYFGDPLPTAPPGPTERLWEYEVSELFIADEAEHYLEVELAPHGHHLVLELAGVRNVVRSRLPIDYSVRIERVSGALRYYGSARMPWHYVPGSAARANAYLIHGQGTARRYHAHAKTAATAGEAPDFHRLERFVRVQFP